MGKLMFFAIQFASENNLKKFKVSLLEQFLEQLEHLGKKTSILKTFGNVSNFPPFIALLKRTFNFADSIVSGNKLKKFEVLQIQLTAYKNLNSFIRLRTNFLRAN